MKWITRERPKIDRIACPWLIIRFIDPKAEIIYVPAAEVRERADELGAIPFDVPGVEYTHYDDQCTFDYFVKKHNIEDPAVHDMARIVRGADTDLHDIAKEAAGLWAISAGLAHNIKDDYELLEIGMVVYDGLYSWAKYHQRESHAQSPTESLLLEIFNKFLNTKTGKNKKVPAWTKEVKEIIQDQIDTNFSLSLKEISRELDVNPAYLSREFSKYFENLSFGEYIRKMRIERAIRLMTSTTYALTEIAYLTGFSDQSHFTRIFKKHTGETPSAYRNNLLKSKIRSKG